MTPRMIHPKKTAALLILIAFISFPGILNAYAATPAVSFADVKQTDWAYTDIRKLAEASIISGDKPEPRASGNAVPPNETPTKPTFRPSDTLSREECAVVLARIDASMASMPGSDVSEEQSFADVPLTRWSHQYVEAAKPYIIGNTGRYGSLFFYPDAPMVRGDLVAALMRLIGAQLPASRYTELEAFADSGEILEEWKPYIAAAVANSVLLGDDEKKLNLSVPVSRREACALIVRALKGNIDFPDPYIQTLYVPDINSGFYDEYFNGAVFIGDSITMGLRNYVLNERARGKDLLGDARFLCAGSYGLKHAAAEFDPDDVSLNYQGVNMSMEDCISMMETKEVYLMLGMNDWAGATLPDSIIKYGVILDKISAKNPDTAVYIQFCTPVTTDREATKLNNANTDKFNLAIVEMCGERDIDYVDVNTPMKDDNNALKREFASDNYVHMNAAGCEAWIGALRGFVKEKYENALWQPPDSAQPAESYPGSYIELD